MATLTDTAYVARRGIQYGTIGVVASLVLWFVGTGAINYYRAITPPKLPPPTEDFGKLTQVIFPKSVVEGEVEYELQTPTGGFGRFPDRMTIFSAPSRQAGFLDPDRAVDLATRLGFSSQPAQPSETRYRWTQADPLPSTLEVDIVSLRFELKKQWQADPSLVINKRFVSTEQIVQDAQNYLRGARLMPEDVGGNELVTFWRAQGSRLIEAISLSEADFVRVDFPRKPYQIIGTDKKVQAEYNFYTPYPGEGVITVVVSGSTDRVKQVVDVDYDYIPVNYDQKGIYPIKPAEQAWEELKSGKGYISSLKGNKVVARRVSLGYYDSLGNQEYTMPIYIFTGDNELVAYVSAIADSAVKATED